MKNTVFTVFFSLASMGCAFYAMVYPAWFQQHYKRDGKDVFQGYGIFSFYSTASLESPFYASETVLQYRDFCKDNATIPNYMLGDGDQFTTVLCGRGMLSVQATTCTGAAVSVVSLLLAIAAVYNPSAGWGERVVSFCTLVGSLLLAVSLVIWGWLIQQRLYKVDSINSAYTSCKSDETKWSCWFYGYSFWVCLASVIVLSITGYLSSAGRAEKIRYFRKEYERDLAVALQHSMQPDSHQNANTAFTRSDTGNNLAPQHPQQPPYNQGYPVDQQQQQYGGYPPQQQSYQPYPAQTGKPQGYPSQQPYNVPLSAPSSTHSQELDQQQAAYPTHSSERRNHTLLGRQPSGGVV